MTTGATGEAGRRLAVSRARGRRMDVAGAVASLLLLLAVGGFTLALTTPYDYVEHALVAQRWHDGLSQPPPHFFYELLVVAVHDVWSAASWERAGKLVALVFYALLGAVLFAVWRRRTAPSGAGADAGAGPRLAAAVIAAPALALAAPVFLLTVADRNLYVGYVAADAYHNPTIVVLRPLALLLFLLVVEALDGERAASLPALAGIAVLSGLGAFAKPNYALAFVPALVAVCALRWRAGRSLRLDVVSAVVAPLLVVLPVELVLYRHLGTGGGFTLDPLGPLRIDATLFDHGAYTSAGWVLVKLVLSVPTALAVTALAFREVARDTAMRVAWLSFLVAAALAYLAAESGSAEGAGDFFWGTQITGLVLLVAAVTFWVRRGVGPTWRTAAVGAAAALQVGCGIFWWATQLGPSPTGWW